MLESGRNGADPLSFTDEARPRRPARLDAGRRLRFAAADLLSERLLQRRPASRRRRKDADECLAKAKDYLKENPVKPVAKKTAWGAFTGALMGVVIGLITGDFGRVVAAGAAAGAVGGAAQGTFDANSPDGVVRGYTDRCLAERGYEVIGWR